MQNLKFYLIAAPKAADTEKVKELIYEIEYRKEKAAKDKEATARKAAEDSRAQQEAAFRKQAQFLRESTVRDMHITSGQIARTRALAHSTSSRWMSEAILSPRDRALRTVRTGP